MDNEYMDIAIDISKKAKYPYGAIIVKDNKIIGRSDSITNVSNTIYNHAELVAIEDACNNNSLYGDLKGCTLYTSCEPCMMCMGAILYQQISKVVYACRIEDSSKYVIKEIEVKIKDLKELSKTNIKIIEDYNRDTALDVMKNYTN